jgi:hypothetical protein
MIDFMMSILSDDSEEDRVVVDIEREVGNDGGRSDNCTRFNDVVHHLVGGDFILERTHLTEIDVINDDVN